MTNGNKDIDKVSAINSLFLFESKTALNKKVVNCVVRGNPNSTIVILEDNVKRLGFNTPIKQISDYYNLRELREEVDKICTSVLNSLLEDPAIKSTFTIHGIFYLKLIREDLGSMLSSIIRKFLVVKRIISEEKPSKIVVFDSHNFLTPTLPISLGKLVTLITKKHHINVSVRHPTLSRWALKVKTFLAPLYFLKTHIKVYTLVKIKSLFWSDACMHERGEFRKKFGWFENDPIIICTRLHSNIYNVECVVKAIPMVLERVKNARFLFLGKGKLTEKLKQLVHDLNVEKNTCFTGFILHEKMQYYLKNSDIYVSSSLSDGTSAGLLEAMTCKLPCIVSEIAGNKEWIENMKNGLVFPTKDSRALAKKIIMLIKNEDLSTRLAENAFKTVRERANWRANSKVLNNLIERLAEKKVTR